MCFYNRIVVKNLFRETFMLRTTQLFDFQKVQGERVQRKYIDGRWEESINLLSNKIGFD